MFLVYVSAALSLYMPSGEPVSTTIFNRIFFINALNIRDQVSPDSVDKFKKERKTKKKERKGKGQKEMKERRNKDRETAQRLYIVGRSHSNANTEDIGEGFPVRTSSL